MVHEAKTEVAVATHEQVAHINIDHFKKHQQALMS